MNCFLGRTHSSAVTIVAIVVAVALSVGVVSCRKSPPLPGDASAPIGLAEAARQNNAKRVKKLLKAGAAVDAQDNDGVTSLMYAAACDSVDCVRLLLDAGADIEKRDNYGGTVLLWAASGNSAEATRLLIKAGADVNAKGAIAEDGIVLTPLMFAAGSNGADVAAVLIEAGADVDAWGMYADIDVTALMLAAYRNSEDVAKLLIDAGADVNAKNEQGMTALSIAEEFGNSEVAALLRKVMAR